MGDTTIRWTDKSWNPLVGCNRVSPGCAHCYAKALHDMRHRAHLAGKNVPDQYALPFETVQLKPERLEYPLHWRKPQRIFVNSVSDLFHEDVPFGFIDRVFGVMAACPQHTFQILTKRPDRMREYITSHGRDLLVWIEAYNVRTTPHLKVNKPAWPLRNVWLGTSVENQYFAIKRIPSLLKTPAAVRFLSCEPLLGPVDLRTIPYKGDTHYYLDSLAGTYRDTIDPKYGGTDFCFGMGSMRPIDWVIVGGESGPNYRPMDLNWARGIRDQCGVTYKAFFFKQGNARKSEKDQELDGQRWEQMPRLAA